MTFIKIQLRTSSPQSDSGVLYYCLTGKGNACLFSSGKRVLASEWDSRSMHVVIPANVSFERSEYLIEVQNCICKDIGLLNSLIAQFESSGLSYSSWDIIEKFRNLSKGVGLVHFMESLIAKLKSSGSVGTARTYVSAMRSFCKFYGNENLMLSEINASLISEYENWLKGRNVTLNTISFYMRILRAVYNKAVESGLVEQNYPFRKVYTGVEKTVKRAVDISVVQQIRDCDLSWDSHLAFSRDLFMLSFFLRGMSFVDLAFLRKKDLENGVLTYRRRKTWQRLHIKWMPCMEEIVSRYSSEAINSPYLLPIIDPQSEIAEDVQYIKALQRINYSLHKISNMLNIDNLTTYTARHTWASSAHRKNIPVSVICQGMGHSSEKTTSIYLASLEDKYVDYANEAVIGDLL